jgi:TIR domain/Tetratricopeptide repeat
MRLTGSLSLEQVHRRCLPEEVGDVPDFSSRGIFISYRREDTTAYAHRLKDGLKGRFPNADVFIDLDFIEVGVNFHEAIRQAVRSSTVLVALIGRQWATLKGKRWRRRLDDPDDFVRFELREALDRYVRVIPVLVDGARPLRDKELPPELRRLARLNALELSYARYEQDVDRLFDLIQSLIYAPGGKSGLQALERRVRTAEQTGDAAGARNLYAEQAREREQALGPEHPATLAARANLARLTAAAGDAAGAREQYDALLPLYERVLGREHLETLTLRLGQTHATIAVGEVYVALPRYGNLANDAERILGEDHPFASTASEYCALAYGWEREVRKGLLHESAPDINWFRFKH